MMSSRILRFTGAGVTETIFLNLTTPEEAFSSVIILKRLTRKLNVAMENRLIPTLI